MGKDAGKEIKDAWAKINSSGKGNKIAAKEPNPPTCNLDLNP